MRIGLVFWLLGACTQAAPPPPTLPSPREDTRYIQIRNLLGKDPETEARALKLYPLVAPVCADPKERADFIEVAKWSASHSVKEDTTPTQLAADTIEHVATSCFRTHPEAAFDLLARAAAAIPGQPRFDLIRARLEAASGRFDAALASAQEAQKKGSNHAVALLANLQAQVARDKALGYQPGMLDEALKTVAVDPDGNWSPIDVAALVSTRARLLSERAVWEDGEIAQKTLLEANGLYQRLSVPPFLEAHRTRSMDVLCFDSVALGQPKDACLRAATESGNLGAAQVAGVSLDPQKFDLERHAQLLVLQQKLATLPKGAVVLWVVRGDESELIEWARPAATVLKVVVQAQPQLILVDRTHSARASALSDRILALAEAKPSLRISAARDTLAMPCVTALLADRQAPKACPLSPEVQRALERARPFGVALLVGRDLDAEIDDLKLYSLPAALFSVRRSQMEKGLLAWAKSLADVWLVTPKN